MKEQARFLVLILVMVALVLPACVNSGSAGDRVSSAFDEIFSIGMVDVAYAAEPDYFCDGVDDDVQFQQALDALPSYGGEIIILSANYSFSATVDRAIDGVTWTGVGMGANLTYDDSTTLITAGNQVGWIFQNFQVDTGSINISGASQSAILGVWIDGDFTFEYPSPWNTFLGLTDTDSDYSGNASKYVRVRGDELGLEFADAISSYINLTDTNDAYTGSGGLYLQVAVNETMVVFSTIDHGGLDGLLDDDHTQYLLRSVVDTKGDILVATADDTIARLAVGTDGQVLTANSSTTEGVKWEDPNTIEASFNNKSGANSIVGYVYRLDPDNDDSFDYASEDEDAQVVVTPSVIDSNAAGLVIISGYTNVYVDGDTIRGQYLYFSSTSGQAKPSWYGTDGAFAIATANQTGAGLVKAYVMPKERVRAMGWFDEWAKQKSVLLPISGTEQWSKYGVVINTGTFGNIAHPSAIYRDNKVYLYISEADAGVSGYGDIALYTSPDFVTFTRFGTVIAREGTGWQQRTVWTPKVVYDEYETNSSRKWKMWYNGRDTSNVDKLGLAYSSDGETWEKDYASNPLTVTDYEGFSMAVTRIGVQYYGWNYQSAGAFDLHTSNDGITWTRYGQMLAKGSPGQWDDLGVSYPFDFWFMGVHYLLYSGRKNDAGAGHPIKMGIALTADAFHGLDGSTTYTKFPFNPVAKSDQSSYSILSSPTIIPHNGRFYGYFQERDDADGLDDISLFTLP